jgi:predicted amidophosphoribosyltransferase
LAQTLERLTGCPTQVDGVERIKSSSPLGKRMRPTERRRNVAGAFRVRASTKVAFKGKRILVVDDVYTIGATAWAMARCLKRAGVGAFISDGGAVGA